MNFKQADWSKVNGSSYKGEVNTTYGVLVSIFGEPHYVNIDGKVQVEWDIEFDDGTIATIYDWKEYCPVEDIEEWHIGGHERRAAWLVQEIVQKHLDGLVA